MVRDNRFGVLSNEWEVALRLVETWKEQRRTLGMTRWKVEFL